MNHRAILPPLLALHLLLAALAAGAAPPEPRGAEILARAQEALDGERPEEALELLAPLLDREGGKRDGRGTGQARAHLLRSTARFMLGDLEGGRADLDRALDLDPTLRQGWLNRGALALSDSDLDGALAAFREAERLDPEAPENHLNIGAVLLLQGQLSAASERFERYLERSGGSAEAHYLVASNYAMAGYAALATERLAQAIRLEERLRLKARTDRNFAALEDNPQLRELLSTDLYRKPPGSYAARKEFDFAYQPDGGGKLLAAVIDALQLSGEPFDPRVEVTPSWALIWGDMRIKVSGTDEGGGVVELSAPADRFTPRQWETRVERLFQQITVRLYS